MYWKMSIDLSKPAVKSEGNLDPFDGYVTYRLLQETSDDNSILKQEISEFARIVESKYESYDSDDPLDLGEALWISHFFPNEEWSIRVSEVSLDRLELLWQHGYFEESLNYRLAFREFGTSLGLQANKMSSSSEKWKARVDQIHATWADRIFQRDGDITPVMFCSSLLPGVFCRW
jgi:hypothetical protein